MWSEHIFFEKSRFGFCTSKTCFFSYQWAVPYTLRKCLNAKRERLTFLSAILSGTSFVPKRKKSKNRIVNIRRSEGRVGATWLCTDASSFFYVAVSQINVIGVQATSLQVNDYLLQTSEIWVEEAVYYSFSWSASSLARKRFCGLSQSSQ